MAKLMNNGTVRLWFAASAMLLLRSPQAPGCIAEAGGQLCGPRAIRAGGGRRAGRHRTPIVHPLALCLHGWYNASTRRIKACLLCLLVLQGQYLRPRLGGGLYHNVEPVGGGRWTTAQPWQSEGQAMHGWTLAQIPMLLQDYTLPSAAERQRQHNGVGPAAKRSRGHFAAGGAAMVMLGFTPHSSAYCSAVVRTLSAGWDVVAFEAPLYGDFAAMSGALAILRTLELRGYG
jgi:hypothetical protein